MFVHALECRQVSEIEREIASQPACWATAVRRLPEVADRLPTPGQRVAVIGCGTSFHIGRSYAALREEAGSGETDAFAASEFPSGRDYDAIVAVSRSGTTTEVVRALAAVDRARSVAISAVPDPPVPAAAGPPIFLDSADQRSVVQTRFATTVLAILRRPAG